MSFQEAISDGFSKYVDFNGRSSRSAYWYWALFAIILLIAVEIVSAVIKFPLLYIAVALGLFLPNLAVGVRRLHDTGRSGWWLLISFVPLIGFIVLIVFYTQESDGPNQYGEGPDGATPIAAPVI